MEYQPSGSVHRPRSVATTRTGQSRRSSVASRQSQLIKKNTGQSAHPASQAPSPPSRPPPARRGWIAPAPFPTRSLSILTHYGFAGPFELRPSDILIERFSAWKRLVRNLITYFEGIADIEVRSPGGQGPQMTRTRLTLSHDPHRSPTRPRSSASSAGSSRCPS